jgi:hypothetical protein
MRAQHGSRSSEQADARVQTDDLWETHREYAADVYGNIAPVVDIVERGPKSRFSILRRRVERQRKLDACRALLVPFLESDWDKVLSRFASDEQGEFLIRLFICTDEDGRVQRGPHGWPVSIGYRPLCREAHQVDPTRWRNKMGGVPNPQAVKEPLIRAFCEKAHAYWEAIEPGRWTYQQIEAIAEYFFGDPTHRVSHRKSQK